MTTRGTCRLTHVPFEHYWFPAVCVKSPWDGFLDVAFQDTSTVRYMMPESRVAECASKPSFWPYDRHIHEVITTFNRMTSNMAYVALTAMFDQIKAGDAGAFEHEREIKPYYDDVTLTPKEMSEDGAKVIQHMVNCMVSDSGYGAALLNQGYKASDYDVLIAGRISTLMAFSDTLKGAAKLLGVNMVSGYTCGECPEGTLLFTLRPTDHCPGQTPHTLNFGFTIKDGEELSTEFRPSETKGRHYVQAYNRSRSLTVCCMPVMMRLSCQEQNTQETEQPDTT